MATTESKTGETSREEAIEALKELGDLIDTLDAKFATLAAALDVDLDAAETKERTAVSKSDDRAGVDRDLVGLLA